MRKVMLVMAVAFVLLTFAAAHAQVTTSVMAPQVPFYGTDTARTYEGFVTWNGKLPQWGSMIVVDTKDKGSQKFLLSNGTQFHPSSVKLRDGVYVIVKSDEFNHAKSFEILPFVEWQNRTGWKK
ncbi:MAG: hypothetical protein RDV48_19765 [Candidatus Eremiobacteraeota bacterium]|nr:hypothetical protein [Candidatus Eremiobacteraeota bacterium]